MNLFDITDPNKVAQGFGKGNMPVAKGPPPPLSLWERMQNAVAPRPESVGGLLSQEDHKAARQQGLMSLGASLLGDSGWSTQAPSFGQSLGRAIQAGQGAYQGAVDNTVARASAKQGMDMNRMKMEEFKREQARTAQLDAGRQKINSEIGPPPQPGTPAFRQWLEKAIPAYTSIQDNEVLSRLAMLYQGMGNQNEEKGTWVSVPGPDGKPMRRYVKASEGPVQEYQDPPARDAGARLLDEQRMFGRANMLGDDYRSTTTSIAKAADQYRTLVAASDGARAGIPAAQIALVFSFMKTLDPTSVVRESEYATAENARGVPESIRNQWNKIKDGARLTPRQVDDFVSEAGASARQWKRQQDLHIKTFTGRAGRWKIDPADVTMDFFEGLPMGGDGGGGGGGAAKPTKEQIFPTKRRF
jgi:hypothetical protein